MILETNVAAFAEAVAWTTRIIDMRPLMPILSGIKIIAQDGELRFEAFNNEVSACNAIEAQIAQPGQALVRGKMLADIARAISGEHAVIETDDSTMSIKAGKAKFQLQLMSLDAYPELPNLPEIFGQVDAATFLQSIHQSCVCVATDNTTPVLTGVHMKFQGDRVVMESSDSFRACSSSFQWTPSRDFGDQQELVIKGSLLKDFGRSVSAAHNVAMHVSNENEHQASLVGFLNDGRTTTVQTIDSRFPNIDWIFVNDYPIQAVVHRQTLIDAIKRVALVGERGIAIQFTLSGNSMTLYAGSADVAVGSEVIDVDLDSDGQEVHFSIESTFLLDGLQAISEPYVRWKIIDPSSPMELNGQQEQDGEESLDFRYVVCPTDSEYES